MSSDIKSASSPLVIWCGTCGCGHSIERPIRGRTENEDNHVWVNCAECGEIALLENTKAPSGVGEAVPGP